METTMSDRLHAFVTLVTVVTYPSEVTCPTAYGAAPELPSRSEERPARTKTSHFCRLTF
jgi:hypothetical protein